MSSDARRDEELATQRRARILGLNYFDTSSNQKNLYPEILPTNELQQMRLVPLQVSQNNIHFGITNNTSHQILNNIRQRFLDHQLSFSLISDIGFRDYMHLYNPPARVVYQDIAVNTAGTESLLKQVSSTLEQVKADDVLAYLVQQAHQLQASDIHVETGKESVRVRFRMDGVLHPIAELKLDKYRLLISSIASAGNISTASDQAQQGHIAQKVKMADGNEVDLNLRLETVPTINGMDVVMRLFSMSQEMYTLDRLDLSDAERILVDDIIHRPSGLVLVVGPTGSGKTTTLYSMLNELNNDQRKLITIEDPVEYQLSGITQISVTSKNSQEINFAERLRAVLRLDPDIVMVGEIRDLDTAKTALQASLTGHLVLSTFHASSAAAALTRLMDVIGQNPLFVSAIRLIMAQRLVRRLDNATKQPYMPDSHVLDQLRQVVESLPANFERPDLNNLQLFKPGTSAENPYGYKGQLALREQFTMDGQIREVLEQKGANLSMMKIEQAAIMSGMKTMLQDGVLKVIAGQTTVEELYRVVG